MILIFISEVIDARRRHTSNRHHRNNARTSCHSNGGSCEPMFGCILKQGYMSGSCHGFLQVCCITPTFVSRRFKENSIFDSGPPVCFIFRLYISGSRNRKEVEEFPNSSADENTPKNPQGGPFAFLSTVIE